MNTILSICVFLMMTSCLEAFPYKSANRLTSWKGLFQSDSEVQKRSTQSVSVASSVCLGAHNAKRALHQNVPDMAWDSTLASESSSYARYLAENNLFQHSDTQQGNYGENLYYFSRYSWGTASSPSGDDPCTKAVQSWYDEISQYDYSNPGFSSATGHFTQVVWKSTTSVGVGVATNTYNDNGWTVTKTYVVARYKPPGNMMGQFADNVPPLI